jgi:hypothetical protein
MLQYLLVGRDAGIQYWGMQKGSIEWFIEDQAFSPSYDSAPPPLLPSVSSTDKKRKTEKERQLADGRGGEGVWALWEEPNHTKARKPGPQQIMQYSLGEGEEGDGWERGGKGILAHISFWISEDLELVQIFSLLSSPPTLPLPSCVISTYIEMKRKFAILHSREETAGFRKGSLGFRYFFIFAQFKDFLQESRIQHIHANEKGLLV